MDDPSPGPSPGAAPSGVLTCGCTVRVTRDDFGRAVGTITRKGETCTNDDHQPGHVVVMPGREHAGPR